MLFAIFRGGVGANGKRMSAVTDFLADVLLSFAFGAGFLPTSRRIDWFRFLRLLAFNAFNPIRVGLACRTLWMDASCGIADFAADGAAFGSAA